MDVTEVAGLLAAQEKTVSGAEACTGGRRASAGWRCDDGGVVTSILLRAGSSKVDARCEHCDSGNLSRLMAKVNRVKTEQGVLQELGAPGLVPAHAAQRVAPAPRRQPHGQAQAGGGALPGGGGQGRPVIDRKPAARGCC